jgi:hypothetical protein
MSSNKKPLCVVCANSGLARATLVNKEVDGRLFHERIDVLMCSEHFEEGEQTIASFELPTQVVGVVNPTEN